MSERISHAPYPAFPIGNALGEVSGEQQAEHEAFRVRHFTEEYWTKQGFDLDQELGELHGPTVEIGGPTTFGHRVLEGAGLPQPLFISNIGYENRPVVCKEDLDFLADGRHMPFADQSVGVVLAAAIPKTHEWIIQSGGFFAVREHIAEEYQAYCAGQTPKTNYSLRMPIIAETARILMPQGMFVFTAGTDDIAFAEHQGLELVQTRRTLPRQDTMPGLTDVYSAIFQKVS